MAAMLDMLGDSDIDALLRATHPDPFAVLGPHLDAKLENLWIRALVPGAEAVEVLGRATPDAAPTVVATLDAIEPKALFEGRLTPPSVPVSYKLRVHYPLGHVEDIEDPYRFGSSLGELDRHLLAEGSHRRPWQVLGAHPRVEAGFDGEVSGVRFCVWAPNAARVSVVGEFNAWDGRRHPMRLHPGAGVWELFVPGVELGALYKYELRTLEGHILPGKADPYALSAELRPKTASIVAASPPTKALTKARAAANRRDAPMAIYEVHLGSWRRSEANDFLDWATLADELPAYVAELGFTHVELLPIAEHPFDGSWGYQVTGLYAPTQRFGDPHGEGRGLEALIAACHARGLGVILDWVPAHFPNDAHALARFDGTALYEYADPREGFHADWNTLIYNFGRNEVRNLLIGNALYWLECWGVDGLRVDAVASMLYRDYSRPADQWIPNVHGGRENLEAVSLLRRVNALIHAEVPGAITVAEESTTWPGVSRPSEAGGLGFDYKWNMGWMHDTLAYMAQDPIHRKHHHHKMTFAITYAYTEDFVLPLSHDEVVHGKGSLIAKMAGDPWQKFANLRAYYAFMWTYPGKKLLFMGGEFAQVREWNHDRGLDWHLLEDPSEPTDDPDGDHHGDKHSDHHGDKHGDHHGDKHGDKHRGVQALIRELNELYASCPALYELDCEPSGFEWLAADDVDHSVYAYLRQDRAGGCVLVVCNFTPVPREGYRIGIPEPGAWRERLNTDAARFGGADIHSGADPTHSEPVAAHGQAQSLALTLPPLATLVLVPA